MSIFGLTDFERQGQVDNDVRFDNLDEAKQVLSKLTDNALRSIQIYTPDMEIPLYDDPAFIDSLLTMARGNRHARIQILSLDISPAIKRGHQLLQLAQTLTSTIEIRVPSEEYQEDNLAFLLVDHGGFMYRPDAKVYQGIYNPGCRVRGQKLAEIFTMAWEHAELDPQTRRLNI